MASYVIQALNAVQIEQSVSGAYYNIIVRGSGFVRDTGVQYISGEKTFYDNVYFTSGVYLTGDFGISGKVAGDLTPKTNNLYNLGSSTNQWANLFVDGIGRIDDLHVDVDASVSGNLNVTGNTAFGGKIYPSGGLGASVIPDSNNAYDLGSAANQFKNAYFDGTVQTDALQVDQNATVSSSLIVGTNLTVTGTATVGSVYAGGGLFGTSAILTGLNIPATATSEGISGQISLGGEYLYICTGTNLWGRTHVTGWT